MNMPATDHQSDWLVHKILGICKQKKDIQMNAGGFELVVSPLVNNRSRVVVYVPTNRLKSETRALSQPSAISQALRILQQPRTSRGAGRNWDLVIRRFKHKLTEGSLNSLAEVARDTFTLGEWGEVEQGIYSEAVLRMAEEIALVENISVEMAQTKIINTIKNKRLKHLSVIETADA